MTETKELNSGTYSASRYLYSGIKINESRILVKKGIDYEPDEEHRGGIIIFSTDVNASELSTNKLVNWLKQKLKAKSNRIKYTNIIDDIANKREIVGVDTDTLISIAEDLCESFNQETVLVKDYNSKRIMFVNNEREV